MWDEQDLAKYAKVSERTVRRWMRDPLKGTYLRIGRLVRFEPESVKTRLRERFGV
jgi:hypothetical protein